MDYTRIPIIVVCCYIIGEMYKYTFRNKKETYKIIPILTAVSGGILGIIIYYTTPEMIGVGSNIWKALGMGIVSGFGSTGTNQLIKQLLKKEENNNDNKS